MKRPVSCIYQPKDWKRSKPSAAANVVVQELKERDRLTRGSQSCSSERGGKINVTQVVAAVGVLAGIEEIAHLARGEDLIVFALAHPVAVVANVQGHPWQERGSARALLDVSDPPRGQALIGQDRAPKRAGKARQRERNFEGGSDEFANLVY